MHMKLGEISSLVVSSADVAKQVMKTQDAVFASRPTILTVNHFSYGSTDIAFSPYGEYWRHVRKISTLELLSTKRVQSFRSLREEEFSNLCRWIASNAGSTINITKIVEERVYNIITQASTGKKRHDQALFISIMKAVIELIGTFNVGDLYPSYKIFSMIGGRKKSIERIQPELDKMFENIIEEHKLSSSSKIDDDQGNDLLSVLLKFNEDSDLRLTIDNIKAVLIDMFIAGIETSATTVDWAMTEMLKHPKIMKTAQDEVQRVFGGKGYVDESSLHELNYVKLIIKETLRMHPPLPLLLPRESMEQCEIGGYRIPVKTQVMVNAWAIGRDLKYWEDPESFKPERFLEKYIDYKVNDFEYIPFGGGRRICPGMTFGLANVELPLAMLLYHFDWHLPNQMKSEELDMIEKSSYPGRRRSELHVIPVVIRPVPDELT